MFNEAETELEQPEPKQAGPEEEPTTSPRKQPKRKPLPKDLPREVVHDTAKEDKVCACCNGELHKIGAKKSDKLKFIPTQVKVIEHVRPNYACSSCEKDGTQNKIKQAPVPASIIPKGYGTPSLLSLPTVPKSLLVNTNMV
ncbi:MAG: transposase [Paraglaciecola sp.]